MVHMGGDDDEREVRPVLWVAGCRRCLHARRVRLGARVLLGVVLFGAGIGNATSLPPLIAQVEFVMDDVPRVVSLIISISQATYAFAPAAFGRIREFAPQLGGPSIGAAPWVFISAALIQGLAIVAFLAGRHR